MPVHIDAEHAIAHNKESQMDVDNVIAGSFKLTDERNAENLLAVEGVPDLAAKYSANFEKHFALGRIRRVSP